MLLAACGSNTQQVVAKKDSAAKNPANDTSTLALRHERDSLLHRFDALSSHFGAYPEAENTMPTFHHHSFYDAYGLRENLLSAGVDTNGRIFLISNIQGADGLQHDHVSVRVGDSLYRSSTGKSLAAIVGYTGKESLSDMQVGLGHYVTVFYDSAVDCHIIDRICTDSSETISARVYEGQNSVKPFYVSGREKKVIRDCRELAAVLQRLNVIDKTLGKRSLILKDKCRSGANIL